MEAAMGRPAGGSEVAPVVSGVEVGRRFVEAFATGDLRQSEDRMSRIGPFYYDTVAVADLCGPPPSERPSSTCPQ
jgi:hypothetical protein